MRWPWQKEAKSSTFLTLDGGGTVAAGLPPFASSLMLAGTEGAARSSSSLMAIVNWAMTQGSEPPLNVERRNSEGEWELAEGHPAQALLLRPDPDNIKASFSQLMQICMESLVICGNAYFYKLRAEGSGRVLGITPIRAASVNPRTEGGRLVGYQINLSGGQYITVPPEDVVHVMDGQDPTDPFIGRSRLKEAAAPVATDREIAAYTLAITKSPAPSYLVSPKDLEIGFTTDHAQEIKQKLLETTTGARAGGAVVPTIPMSMEKLSYSPDEMALDRIQAAIDAKLAAIFGLPAMVVGFQVGLERSTFANYAEAREAAVEQFLIPKWRLIEDALTLQLGPDFWGDDPSYRFAFAYSDIRALSDDTDALYKRTTEAFLANAISRGDWKRAVGMNPNPDDDLIYAYMLKGTDLQTLMAGVVAGKRADVPG
jgi:phage portal protein BeeE